MSSSFRCRRNTVRYRMTGVSNRPVEATATRTTPR
jgi:hypothetical protein